MSATSKRITFWSVLSVALVIALIALFWPRPQAVDLVTLQRGALTLSISEEAKARVHDIYTLSAPVTGRLRRIDADVGDQVDASNTVVAQIEPIDAAFLDSRSEAQAVANVQAAESALALAVAEQAQAQAELDFASAEHRRMRELKKKSTVSMSEVDNAERAYRTRRASLATAQAALQMRRFELERAKASLVSPVGARAAGIACECLKLFSPINGQVLSVLIKSESVIQAGSPLIEIGDPKDLEVVVDLLSADAVKVAEGQPVIISGWGGADLEGRVSKVEPIGFTKVSALGIEEQRVNVIVALESDYQRWKKLGHGYQLDVRIILSELDDVVLAPLTSLFRKEGDWAVFVDRDGIAEQVLVTLGEQNGQYAQVLDGVTAGDRVIASPGNHIRDGMQIVAR